MKFLHRESLQLVCNENGLEYHVQFATHFLISVLIDLYVGIVIY